MDLTDQLTKLGLMFNRTLNVVIHEEYEDGLSSYSPEAIEAGIKQAMRCCEHFPRLKQLRDLCGAKQHQIDAYTKQLPAPELNDYERKIKDAQCHYWIGGLGVAKIQKKVEFKAFGRIFTKSETDKMDFIAAETGFDRDEVVNIIEKMKTKGIW